MLARLDPHFYDGVIPKTARTLQRGEGPGVERHRARLAEPFTCAPRYPFRNVSTVTFGGHKNRTGGVIIPNPQFVYTCIAPTRFKPV